MAIGILVGTYSSIYIASPSLLWLETRFGDASSGAVASGRETAGAAKAPKAARAPKGEARQAPKGEARKAPKSKSSKAKKGKAKAGSRRRRPS
jgi:hypothetical protein